MALECSVIAKYIDIYWGTGDVIKLELIFNYVNTYR